LLIYIEVVVETYQSDQVEVDDVDVLCGLSRTLSFNVLEFQSIHSSTDVEVCLEIKSLLVLPWNGTFGNVDVVAASCESPHEKEGPEVERLEKTFS